MHALEASRLVLFVARVNASNIWYCNWMFQLAYCACRLCRVINKGVVVEDGSHNELIEAGGVYATLVRRQMQKNTSSASLGSMAHTESCMSLRSLGGR